MLDVIGTQTALGYICRTTAPERLGFAVFLEFARASMHVACTYRVTYCPTHRVNDAFLR